MGDGCRGKVGIAPPSTKLLDGVGWESCSGSCCGCTDPQAVVLYFRGSYPHCSTRDNRVTRKLLAVSGLPFLKWKRG